MTWKGLKPKLKGITHYKKKRFGSFEELRVALRRKISQRKIKIAISRYQSKLLLLKEKMRKLFLEYYSKYLTDQTTWKEEDLDTNANTLGFCVNFRQLNKKTKKVAYALPRIEEMLDAIAEIRYFSVIDMKSGYHQVEIYEAHKERAALTVGPLGLYEFNRRPFGLTGAPSTYQRLMQDILENSILRLYFH